MESGIADFCKSNHVVGPGYTRIVCGAALQNHYEILSNNWTFSRAMHGSTHQCVSYLDARVCVACEQGLFNFHLLAISRSSDTLVRTCKMSSRGSLKLT